MDSINDKLFVSKTSRVKPSQTAPEECDHKKERYEGEGVCVGVMWAFRERATQIITVITVIFVIFQSAL